MKKIQDFFENTLLGQFLFVLSAFVFAYGLFYIGYIFQ